MNGRYLILAAILPGAASNLRLLTWLIVVAANALTASSAVAIIV